MMSCLNAWKIGLIAVLAAGLPASAVAMQWPDTGQTLCYDNTKQIPCPTDENSPFYGQDAQFQGPVRSYTKLGQGGVELPDDAAEWIMVRDNVTGLIWEMKNNDDGVADYTNPHDVDNLYGWCYSGKEYCLQTNDGDQEDFIATLNSQSFGGQNDWRIPNINELDSIVYAEKVPVVDWKYFLPTDGGYYSGYYWSSTISILPWPWSIHFLYGEVKPTPSYYGPSAHIRAVRSGK